MGATEEAGNTARTAIDALKGNPGLLVLVLLQMTTLGVLYFVNDRQNERRQVREMAMLDRCFPVNKTASIKRDLPLGRPEGVKP